jgi:hypothetical protein
MGGTSQESPTMQNTTAKEAAPRALHTGDSIYFSDAEGQAQHGMVVAVGKHGATVDCQGDDGATVSHSVLHQNVIGHRKRAERTLVILDRGEDGSIAVDETGKRVFLRGQMPEDQPEQEMNKALSGTLETADEARLMRMVSVAVEPLQMALATMQASHQAEINRLGAIVAALAGQQPQAITLQMPEQTPAAIHVDVNVPEQPAPVVHVEVPARKTITEIERNRDGDIIRAVQKDADQ